MLVSWNWLTQYVALDMNREELENRLAMSGLNHEGTESVFDDLAIDLEVTSNRPDCLGHIGVAREIAVLYDLPISFPNPNPTAAGPPADSEFTVTIETPELCPRYTARIIRGVKIGESPQWMQDQLRTVFLPVSRDWKPVNNIVDITNYVLMECGQPLHAFDLAKLQGQQIKIREAADGEEFEAIDHHVYKLSPGMCVIADANRPVAIAGIMGGADSEVGDDTVDILIESAAFSSMATRSTSRALNLHSPSSYRFERALDPEGIEWAANRACELILEHGGGTLDEGLIDVGATNWKPEPVVMRLSQIERILGISISVEEVKRILLALGNTENSSDKSSITITPPTWRRDLMREADLLEEIARIHGYEKIPEDVGVPMAASFKSDWDRIAAKLRTTMTAVGFDESLTASVVPNAWTQTYSPWSDKAPLRTISPMLKGADALRTSLVPSLLEVRRINQSLANPDVELFETAKIYLPQEQGLPREQWTLGITSGQSFYHLKGVIETILSSLKVNGRFTIESTEQDLLHTDYSASLRLNGEHFGFIGEVDAAGLKTFSLRSPASIAEIRMDLLVQNSTLIPQHSQLSSFPAITRDLNIVVAESVRWDALETSVLSAMDADILEDITYQETYRDPERDGTDMKRVLFTVKLRRNDQTMTNEEADKVREKIVSAIESQLDGKLLG
ncbi:MAG: phenylalanine--tRNA ligase subunit beta [Planctomycetaceae bacterium]|nr:phenylalanine--tRNA ligase subunit beta [Planctomycetaceae bacterium]